MSVLFWTPRETVLHLRLNAYKFLQASAKRWNIQYLHKFVPRMETKAENTCWATDERNDAMVSDAFRASGSEDPQARLYYESLRNPVDDPMDVDTALDESIYRMQCITQWMQEHQKGPLSLLMQASLADDFLNKYHSSLFEGAMPFSQWMQFASESWASPMECYARNIEFYTRIQPWLTDYKKNFSRVKGNRSQRVKARVNLIETAYPIVQTHLDMSYNMPPMRVMGKTKDLLYRVTLFPDLNDALTAILWQMPCGIDYISHMLGTIIRTIRCNDVYRELFEY